MDAIEAIRTRRSVRAYCDRPVERELIEALIVDASHAPFTPIAADGAWRFTVIEGVERLATYGELALAFARANRPQLRGWEWTERAGFSVFHGAPVAVVISGRVGLPVALEECTRAGQVLDIAAHARGFGACWIGSPMPWLREPTTRAELEIPLGWLPCAAFALGWPDTEAKQPPPVPRLRPVIEWVS